MNEPLRVAAAYVDSPSPEVCVLGTREGIFQLAEFIGGAAATAAVSTRSIANYCASIAAFHVRVLTDQNVRVSLDRSAGVLELAGDESVLNLVADNLRELAHRNTPGDHWHMEHVPGHFFLAPDSTPIVFELEDPLDGELSDG